MYWIAEANQYDFPRSFETFFENRILNTACLLGVSLGIGGNVRICTVQSVRVSTAFGRTQPPLLAGCVFVQGEGRIMYERCWSGVDGDEVRAEFVAR